MSRADGSDTPMHHVDGWVKTPAEPMTPLEPGWTFQWVALWVAVQGLRRHPRGQRHRKTFCVSVCGRWYVSTTRSRWLRLDGLHRVARGQPFGLCAEPPFSGVVYDHLPGKRLPGHAVMFDERSEAHSGIE